MLKVNVIYFCIKFGIFTNDIVTCLTSVETDILSFLLAKKEASSEQTTRQNFLSPT